MTSSENSPAVSILHPEDTILPDPVGPVVYFAILHAPGGAGGLLPTFGAPGGLSEVTDKHS